MWRTIGFVAVAALCAGSTPVQAANTYSISPDAWSCTGRGALHDVEAGKSVPASAKCLPMMKAGPINVIAFQGEYAFICDRLTDRLGISFYCTYVLTRDVRDGAGKPMRPIFSKVSPSSHFFDQR